MGIFRFFVCLFLLLLSSASFASDIDSSLIDTDGDGFTNDVDIDDDDDGFPDLIDAFPLNNLENSDNDNDGVGNNSDLDDDNDGLLDSEEIALGTDIFDNDTDNDSLPDKWEIENDYVATFNDINIISIPTGLGFCTLIENEIFCDNHDSRNLYDYISEPNFEYPINLFSGPCVYGENKFTCWGGDRESEIQFPVEINNLLDISVTYGGRTPYDRACYVNGQELNCWGWERPLLDETTNPTKVDLGGDRWGCIVDAGIVKCFGNIHPNNNVYIDSLEGSSADDVLVYEYGACILFDGDVSCYAQSSIASSAFRNPQFGDKKVKSITDAQYSYTGCAILEDNTAKCWGNNAQYLSGIETLSGVVQVSLDKNGETVCALSKSGFSCFAIHLEMLPTPPGVDPDADGYVNGDSGQFDAFPLNSLEWVDTDIDGIGNNADLDDDNDGISDLDDLYPLVPQGDEIPNLGFESSAVLDIDANGSFDALTDGLIILRYAFGLRGQSLIDDVISEDANRTEAADIEAYIETLLP